MDWSMGAAYTLVLLVFIEERIFVGKHESTGVAVDLVFKIDETEVGK